MGWRGCTAACVAVSLALLLASAPAAGGAKRITGTLSAPGQTVIALDADGEAASTRTNDSGKFKLEPPGRRVSLHLRGADGVYAGPIVIDRKGKRGRKAILGVEAGSELGKVRVRNGYSKLKEALPREDQDRTRKARARKGVPIGADNFGRVFAQASGTPESGQDHDLDGVPGILDIDDDGDLVLDDVDPVAAPHAARAHRGLQFEGEIFDVTSVLPLTLESTANANTPGSTDAQIESVLPAFGRLAIEVLSGESPELDCAGDTQADPPRPGLAYCSSGGTGRLFQPGVAPADWPQFPGCCDGDGDGFGTVAGTAPPGGSTAFMTLAHNATTAQVGTGDLLIGRAIRDGEAGAVPATLQFAFATSPALASYDDGAGNAATVPYPVPSGGPGTHGNGFPVVRGPSGDVAVTLTFWRPQRRPIEDEACLSGEPACDWVDIGGLTYNATVGHVGPAGTPPGGTEVNQPCPQTAFSSSDPQLGAPSPFLPGNAFTDQALDQAASPANTFTYTLNLTDCFPAGVPWDLDDGVDVGFGAIVSRPGAGAGASQAVSFTCAEPAGCAP